MLCSVTATPQPRLARHVLRAAPASLMAASVLLAAPATASVPEGWSDPEPVDTLEALLLLVGGPLLLIVLITLAVYLPSLAKGESRTGTGTAREWFGGPRKSVAELAAPDSDDSKAGGASARW